MNVLSESEFSFADSDIVIVYAMHEFDLGIINQPVMLTTFHICKHLLLTEKIQIFCPKYTEKFTIHLADSTLIKFHNQIIFENNDN